MRVAELNCFKIGILTVICPFQTRNGGQVPDKIPRPLLSYIFLIVATRVTRVLIARKAYSRVGLLKIREKLRSDLYISMQYLASTAMLRSQL